VKACALDAAFDVEALQLSRRCFQAPVLEASAMHIERLRETWPIATRKFSRICTRIVLMDQLQVTHVLVKNSRLLKMFVCEIGQVFPQALDGARQARPVVATSHQTWPHFRIQGLGSLPTRWSTQFSFPPNFEVVCDQIGTT